MSKLLTEPKNGYVKPKDGASSGIYPKTLVEAVYWDKKKMTLEEAMENGASASVETEIPVDGMKPNTVYNLGTIAENTTFVMAEGEEGKVNHYFWVFETGADVPEITWPEGIRLWKDNKAPVIAANHHYEISLYDGVALYIAIEMTVPTPPTPGPDLTEPLTFEAKEDNTPILAMSPGEEKTLLFSLDNGETWESATIGQEPATLATLNAGDTIQLKGDAFCPEGMVAAADFSGGEVPTFKPFYAYGNIMSLLSAEGFEELTEVPAGAFSDFFYETLVNIRPEHPLLLPATTLGDGCYSMMFSGCTSLTSAPELPATSLSQNCYKQMFSGCYSLTSAPALPATTLAISCYQEMFEGCTSLTAAPELPATELKHSCYAAMFDGCTSLSEVRCYAIKVSAGDQNHTTNWLRGVAASGVFYLNKDNSGWPQGSDGIPSGWTVVEES